MQSIADSDMKNSNKHVGLTSLRPYLTESGDQLKTGSGAHDVIRDDTNALLTAARRVKQAHR